MSQQSEEEIIPLKSARKLASLFRQSSSLQQDKHLQNQILDWAKDMLAESRTEWNDLHAASLDAAIFCAKKTEAIKRGKIRDEKYAPFRKHFYNVQQQKFIEYQNAGQKLSANAFVMWFLKNKPQHIDIPYKETNQMHKLTRLAQENNRILNKCKS